MGWTRVFRSWFLLPTPKWLRREGETVPKTGLGAILGNAVSYRNLCLHSRTDSADMFRASLIILMLCLLQTGCVHRRVTINSSPQGALVRVDGKDIGYTPASMDFTWYGTREVQLLKDGYETETRLIEIQAPWYQRFPFDFVSDNFLGHHKTDHRRYNLPLRPKQATPNGDVIDRGRALRSEAMHGL